MGICGGKYFRRKTFKIFYLLTCNCLVRVAGGGGGGGCLLTPILGLENLRDNLLKRNCASVSLGKALCARAGAGGGAACVRAGAGGRAARRRSSRSRMVAPLSVQSVQCPHGDIVRTLSKVSKVCTLSASGRAVTAARARWWRRAGCGNV